MVCFLSLLFLMPCKAFAWLRDINLSNSTDSLGVGAVSFYPGIYLVAGEKIIDNKTSIGFFYLPTAGIFEKIVEATYNKQIIGATNEGFAASFSLGGAGVSGQFAPWLGINFQWQLFDPLFFRLRTLLFYPYSIEFAFRPNKKFEASLMLLPFSFSNSLRAVSVINLTYCF